ncbi:hypothetical protein ACH5RR_021207 [Cinchona calisaya]|uniref:Uncharacterized protein n=1 Tax=Cinchona calisaya TaxID=153742 RepID=A0ABD2ZHW8_9GENT
MEGIYEDLSEEDNVGIAKNELLNWKERHKSVMGSINSKHDLVNCQMGEVIVDVESNEIEKFLGGEFDDIQVFDKTHQSDCVICENGEMGLSNGEKKIRIDNVERKEEELGKENYEANMEDLEKPGNTWNGSGRVIHRPYLLFCDELLLLFKFLDCQIVFLRVQKSIDNMAVCKMNKSLEIIRKNFIKKCIEWFINIAESRVAVFCFEMVDDGVLPDIINHPIPGYGNLLGDENKAKNFCQIDKVLEGLSKLDSQIFSSTLIEDENYDFVAEKLRLTMIQRYRLGAFVDKLEKNKCEVLEMLIIVRNEPIKTVINFQLMEPKFSKRRFALRVSMFSMSQPYVLVKILESKYFQLIASLRTRMVLREGISHGSRNRG